MLQLILLQASIGGAFDSALVTQCLQQCPHKGGLACAQVTVQV